MIIHKFGGTSLGSAERIAAVADIVLMHQATGPVVVVSAMSGVTNQLVAGARSAAKGQDAVYRQIKAKLLARHLDVVNTLLTNGRERLEVGGFIEDRLHTLEQLYRSIAVLGELTVRGTDAAASVGEMLSSHILAAVLRERGVRAQALNATELIVTDDHFGAANPLMADTGTRARPQIARLLERATVPVVTGFIGATATGIPTTLGRGGSDYSAAILGAALDADEVWIWSDVNGILTADPNLVAGARVLLELSYAEAAELAYYGADVLHPKTIRPVVEHGTPLRLLNSFEPDHPGTRIVAKPTSGRERLPAILSSGGLSLIAIGAQDGAWSLATGAQVLQCLSDAGIEVLMFSQSFSEHGLNLVVREQDQAHCLHTLRPLLCPDVGTGATCQLGVKERVATVSVVGVPGWNGVGVLSHAFNALGKHNARIIAIAQAATEHNVSFCIPEDQVTDTVRFLHRELGLDQLS